MLDRVRALLARRGAGAPGPPPRPLTDATRGRVFDGIVRGSLERVTVDLADPPAGGGRPVAWIRVGDALWPLGPDDRLTIEQGMMNPGRLTVESRTQGGFTADGFMHHAPDARFEPPPS